jgi:hypothetical protein
VCVISFIVARSENKSLVRFARVSLPLGWFPPDAVVRHTFPMRPQGPVARPTVALALEVHRSENGQPAFLSPDGKLLVALTSDRPDGAKPFFPGMFAPGPPTVRGTDDDITQYDETQHHIDDEPQNSRDILKQEEPPQHIDDEVQNTGDIPKQEESPQNIDDEVQNSVDVPQHIDESQNSGDILKQEESPQNIDDEAQNSGDVLHSGDQPQETGEDAERDGDTRQPISGSHAEAPGFGTYGMAPQGIPYPVPVKMPDGSIVMMIPVPFAYPGYFPNQVVPGFYSPGFHGAVPWRS